MRTPGELSDLRARLQVVLRDQRRDSVVATAGYLLSVLASFGDRGLSPRNAIVEGFSRAAPVLVAAATIMTLVFAGFAPSTFAIAASIAFGLMVGIAADALIVRMILMPAAMSLLGRSAWWLPTWLDRILPHVDTEVHALDEAPAPRRSELVSVRSLPRTSAGHR